MNLSHCYRAYHLVSDLYDIATSDQGRFVLVGAKLHLASQIETLEAEMAKRKDMEALHV